MRLFNARHITGQQRRVMPTNIVMNNSAEAYELVDMPMYFHAGF